MNETIELCSKVFITWNFANHASNAMVIDEKYNAESFIARILRKKIEVFQIPVKLSDYLIILIELCTGGNPGVSQVMLKEIMSKVPNLTPEYEIKPEDFARVYSIEFPVMENSPEWEEHFSKLWDAQKSDGNNLCDTRDWWMELFKS